MKERKKHFFTTGITGGHGETTEKKNFFATESTKDTEAKRRNLFQPQMHADGHR
jgi:hypothetical protein